MGTRPEPTSDRDDAGPADADLVEAARRGDAGAFGEPFGEPFGELVRRHQRHALAVAISIVGDAAEAEDLTQEAFVRASRNLDMLADPAKFGPWTRRVVFGVCVDWLRAFRPQLYRSGPALEEEAATLASDEPTPLERLERLELSERVLGALARLPERYRVPLTMYHVDGLSHERVARALDLPVGTVRSLVTRARRKLAPMLAAYAQEVFAINNALDDVLPESPSPPPRLLHVLNGDSVRVTLERSSVPGRLAVWADVLHEGPVPASDSRERFLEARARFHADVGDEDGFDSALAHLLGWDEGLASFREHDEVVLWFEHDLFDQLLLIHHLDYYGRRDLGRTRLSLICVGEYPGFEPFHGLGQLDADQLASLLGTRQRVTGEQVDLGRRTWRAFTAPDPTELDEIARGDTSALPFLAGALRRFLEEYPSTRDGLPRTERQILGALAHGPMKPVDLFRAMYPLEERVFMGDTTFWDRVTGLAAARRPLVACETVENGRSLPDGEVRITDDGRAVLDGRADAVELNGVDRWLGGVRLEGDRAAWRWDEREGRLRHGR